MIKKILIVNATPKTDGLCYSFVETASQATANLGLDYEVLRLAGLGLKKCLMCRDGWGICIKEHRCIQDQDEFAVLQQKVKAADAFIYISPVYWGEISEELKIFWDRLRRCETTKQWNEKDEVESFHKNKPSIIVASAGGGGGGCLSTLSDMERIIDQLGQHVGLQNGTAGTFDYIAVTRWNQDYKRETLKAAIAAMVAINNGEKEVAPMNHLADLEKF